MDSTKNTGSASATGDRIKQPAPTSGVPKAWIDALNEAEADIAAGRVVEVDIDALCREIDAEADAIELLGPSARRP